MHCKSYSHFFSKKFQHICVLLDVNFNESLTNDVISFEQLGPELFVTFMVNEWTSQPEPLLLAYAQMTFLLDAAQICACQTKERR